MNTENKNKKNHPILTITKIKIRRSTSSRYLGRDIIETPEEASELGARMAKESARKLKLHLTA